MKFKDFMRGNRTEKAKRPEINGAKGDKTEEANEIPLSSDVTYDRYDITLRVFEKDAVGNRNLKEENKYTAYIYPLSYPQEGTSFMTDIAGFVKNNARGSYDCLATTTGGKKTLVIMLEDHGVILKGRWLNGKFISSAFVMNSSAEDMEVRVNQMSSVSEKYGKIGHLVKTANGIVYHLLPVKEEGKLIVCGMESMDKTIIGCGDYKVSINGMTFRYDPDTTTFS